jgi:hypothetical protein
MRHLGNKTRFGMAICMVRLLLVLCLIFPQTVWAAGLTTNSHTAVDRLEISSGTELIVAEDWNLTVGSGGIANQGTLTGGSGTISTEGSWENRGDFTRNTSTVVLDGTNQSVLGDTHFYNLTKATTVTDTLTFEEDTTQTIEHTLILGGAKDNRLSLRSTSEGMQYTITLETSGSQTLNQLDVKDSDASGGQTLTTYNSLDSENNLNWEFPGPVFASMDPIILEVGKTAGPEEVDGTKLSSDPENEGAYTWASSSEDVATVSENGTVAAIAYKPDNGKNYGTSWITVTDSEDREKSKLVKVYDHLSVSPTILEDKKVGESDTLTASGATGTYTWESSDPNVASVVAGNVTYWAKGSATITVSDGTYPLKFDECTVAVTVTDEGNQLSYDELILNWGSGETTTTILAGNKMNIDYSGGDENYTWSGSASGWLNTAKTKIEVPEAQAAGIYDLTITDGQGTSNTLTLIVPLQLNPYNLSVLATAGGNDLVLGVTEGSASGTTTWTLADSSAMATGFDLVNTSGQSITNTIKREDVDISAVGISTAWIQVTAHDASLDTRCDVTTNRINVVLTNTLKVRAVDSAGNPISNAFIEVLGTGKSGTMYGVNPVEFTDLPYDANVRYKVRVSAAGYLTAEAGNLSASGTIHDVILTAGSARFTGTVHAGGSGLEGATVVACSNEGTYFYTVTDSTGGFSIDVAEEDIANPWKVAVTKSGYTSTSQEGLTLTAGETTSLGDMVITRETVMSWAVHKDPDFANNSKRIIKLTADPAFVDGDEAYLTWDYVEGAGITNYGWMGDPSFQEATQALCIPYTADNYDKKVFVQFTAEPTGGTEARTTVRFDASSDTDQAAVTKGKIDPVFGGSGSLIQSEVEEGDKDNSGFEVPTGGIDTETDLWVRVERTSKTAYVTAYSLAGAVYQVDLVNSNGQVVDSSGKIKRIFLTFKFDPTKWVPYQDAIFYREDGETWTVFPNDNILNVDYLNNTITIESDHLSEWSLMSVAGGCDESGGPLNGSCFIATAAFGSYMEGRVVILREFRDQYLLTNKAGRALVSCYYRHSPSLADTIQESELLKSLTRIVLMPVIGISYIMLHTPPIQQALYLFLMLIVASGGCLFVRKRRTGRRG